MQQIKIRQKIKEFSYLQALNFFGMLAEMQLFFRPRNTVVGAFVLGMGQSASRIGGFWELCRLGDRTQWQLL